MQIAIVGIDCATEPAKTGLALGYLENGALVAQEAGCACRTAEADQIVYEWLKSSPKGLIALDAPLGWPTSLARSLQRHEAGSALSESANQMFRRVTDEEIWTRLRKRPFDVGANLIARTAHAALQVLERLRDRLEDAIPLAWSPAWSGRFAAIEVYPAATLLVRGVKGAPSRDSWLTREVWRDRPLPRSSDARDAIVCLTAAADFLEGAARAPDDLQLEAARREGWIWVREH
ncbi:MAG: DUF429 domain-containing protein [Proteobacteria bacterium]|nr:DUF429 domain-containing protein [Pseudomonadota bacterium]